MVRNSLVRRLYFALVAVFALWVACWGLIAPQEIGTALPFGLPPLHARVVGAIYLAGAVLMVGAALARDRASTEVPLTVATTWTGWLLLVSVLHPELFDATTPATRFWFGAYVGFPLAGLLLMSRNGPVHADGRAAPRWAVLALRVQGGGAVLLAALLFGAPRVTASVWPWPLPVVVAEIYAGPLLGLGIGSLMTARRSFASWRVPAAFMLTVHGGLGIVTILHWSQFAPGPARLVWCTVLACGFGAACGLLHRLNGDRGVRPEGTPVLWWVRAWLVVEIGFGVAAIGSISLAPSETATNFAWAIRPFVTAALIGGFYLAVAGLFTAAVLVRTWEQMRVMVLPALLFTSAQLLTTVLHWDKFSTGSTAFAVWFASYLLPPPVFAAAWLVQQRRALEAGNPTSIEARPLGRGLRLGMILLGTILVVDAVRLYLEPGRLIAEAPWPLTPLSARVVLGWILAVGAMLLAAGYENDVRRCRVLAPFLILLLPAIALQIGRFPDQLDWSHPRIAINAALLVALCGIGLALGFGRGREARRDQIGSVPSISIPKPSRPT